MSRPHVHVTCTIDGCSKPHLAHGWCQTHYGRWRRTGDPLAPGRAARPVCAVEDCDRPHHSHGYCLMHKQAWARHGDPNGGERREYREECEMDGCPRSHEAHGLCIVHYTRFRTWGDPFFDGRRFPVCKAGECLKPVEARGYCKNHYDRWKRWGDPLGGSGRAEPMGVALDVEPLVALIEAREGLSACLNYAGLYSPTERDRFEMAYDRAKKRGEIDAAMGALIAVRVLGMHPFFVWGEDWWDEIEDEGLMAA